MELDTVLLLLKTLKDKKVDYCVIGGVALNFHGLPRATMDIDLFVSSQLENINNLKDALKIVFNDPDIDKISHDDLAGDYPAVQYIPPDGTFHLDILTRLGQMYSYDNVEKEIIIFEGIEIPIATAKMLYKMKKNTVRLQDKADAERLRKHFNIEDK